VLSCEDDWHEGTAGVADTSFYGPVLRYLARTAAPAEAVAAVRFAHGLAAYDWAEARSATRVLLPAYTRGDQWIDTPLLHDGGAVAALQAGDAEGARQVVAVTRPRMRRGREDVRGPLVDAWIADAARRHTRDRAVPAPLPPAAGGRDAGRPAVAAAPPPRPAPSR
jgi:hypothetical protein